MDCSVCGKKAEPAFSVIHRTCGHSTHSECIVGDSVPKQCNQCLNPGDFSRTRIEEPHTKDGVDYVQKPGRKQTGSIFSAVGSAVVSRVYGKPAAPPVKTALELVREGIPITDLFKKHGYGLDHMLKEGVTLDDLLVARYKWEDICMFDDVSNNGPHRSLDTFVNGLRMTANHLRDNPDRIPFEAFKKLTNLESSQLCTRLGMEFPELDSLQCCGDKEWNAKHCVRLGLNMDDLISFGLYAEEQYASLMKGLTPKEKLEAERQLGVTEEHRKNLRNLAQEMEEADRLERERFIQEEQEQEPPQEMYPEEEEEEEEEEIGEEIVPKKPFVYEHRFKTKPTVASVKPKANKLAYLGFTPTKKM